MSEGFEKLPAQCEPVPAIDDPVTCARAIGHAYIEFRLADPQRYKLIFLEELKFVYSVLGPATDADAGRSGRRAFDAPASTIGEAVAHGLFKPVDPELAAQAYRADVHSFVSLYISCPRGLADVTTVAATLEDGFIAGLPA